MPDQPKFYGLELGARAKAKAALVLIAVLAMFCHIGATVFLLLTPTLRSPTSSFWMLFVFLTMGQQIAFHCLCRFSSQHSAQKRMLEVLAWGYLALCVFSYTTSLRMFSGTTTYLDALPTNLLTFLSVFSFVALVKQFRLTINVVWLTAPLLLVLFHIGFVCFKVFNAQIVTFSWALRHLLLLFFSTGISFLTWTLSSERTARDS